MKEPPHTKFQITACKRLSETVVRSRLNGSQNRLRIAFREQAKERYARLRLGELGEGLGRIGHRIKAKHDKIRLPRSDCIAQDLGRTCGYLTPVDTKYTADITPNSWIIIDHQHFVAIRHARRTIVIFDANPSMRPTPG
jgi:hypothetical protein